MTCPHCRSKATTKRKHRSALGYRRFSCRSCHRRYNERTGTPFNDLQFPTDIVLLSVLWRLRYKLGFRDVAELLGQRGYAVTRETIRAWEFQFAPLVSERLRARRRGQAGRSRYLDETTSRWLVPGATSTARSTGKATSWTRCSVSIGTGQQRVASCVAWSTSPCANRRGSPQTGILPTERPSAGSWAGRCCTGRANI